jgi:hypothetical protein
MKTTVKIKKYIKNIYWWWRFSWLSKPWFAIKTFIYIQWHAKKIAVNLDECMIALGQMDHTSRCKSTCKKCGDKQLTENPNSDCMIMKTDKRADLIYQGYNALPIGWRWR